MELYDFTATEIINYIVNKQVEEKGISKALAKKLVLNALSYNVVIEEIENQIDYLMEEAV